MNIIIGLFVIVSALVIKNYYKVNGKVSGRIFKMCVALGVFMLFSVQTFDSALLIAMTAAEVLLCAALLWVYRAQLLREKAAIRRRRAVSREHAAVRRTAQRTVASKRVAAAAA